jgi:hypothetical protein
MTAPMWTLVEAREEGDDDEFVEEEDVAVEDSLPVPECDAVAPFVDAPWPRPGAALVVAVAGAGVYDAGSVTWLGREQTPRKSQANKKTHQLLRLRLLCRC